MNLTARLFRPRLARTSAIQKPPIHQRSNCATHNRTMTTETTSNTATPADDKSQQTRLPLPEPPSGSDAIELDVSSGNAVKLDHLGPMVVNRDGTLSRIANWEQMSEMERRNTLRILGKRNQLRMESLKAAEDADLAAK